eukprot:CAMPEP_0204496246 /NCGR_PEP_ID=MMETSP0471-20130131/88319_1 /ASSEMBLY_ACC=CAM_ASM_000602 /TAXON_ID=2969 /ORGANISM="Oxyrrhis marina" /LENGTH=102 /DNA_ID=CAMNT_0051500575 /DNA_START=128 /DNA_END=432 /DNA_ORIENTATION=-
MTGHFFGSYAEVLQGRSWESYITSLSAQLQDGVTQAVYIWEHRDDHDLSAAWAVVSRALNAAVDRVTRDWPMASEYGGSFTWLGRQDHKRVPTAAWPCAAAP